MVRAFSLDQSTLVLRGNEEEASSVLLKGERRVGCGSGGGGQKKDDQFFRHTWEFVIPGPRRGETLAADNYEWPFDYALPGNMSESVEGLDDSWIVYRLKATIERGILAQNIVTRKHVRVVRTLDTDALELSHEMRVDNTWLDKIDYTISSPTKGVIFGTMVEVNFRITPLLKGLKIGEVHTSLVETQCIWIDPKNQERKKGTITRLVAEDNFDFPQDQQTELIDGHDAWLFSRRLALPKSLRQCLQNVNTMGIRTRHNLNLVVKLINPDEHVSQLLASLPLHIYISPNLLLDEDNTISVDCLRGVNPSDFVVGAPPRYGEHRFDTLYNDLDPSGYVTPAGALSGFSTPFDPQSRRGSADNLASLASASVAPIALQTRLDNLDNRISGLLARSSQPDSSFSDDPSVTPSWGTSEDGLDHSDPQHVEFSPEEMSRVPSYSTALRSQHQTPISEVPPIYESINR
ncbi:MAG: hypothetical protein Q9171_005395 [Xanthocarpia ochracea]